MYVYEHCLGFFYTSNICREKHELYHPECCDCDTLIGEANTKEEMYKLLMDYKAINPGHTLGYILNFIEETFKDKQIQKEFILDSKSISLEDHIDRYNLLESIKKSVSEECYNLVYALIIKEPSVESDTNEIIKEKCKTVADLIKLEFYRNYDEIIPSIMADKIDEIVEEVCNDKNN